MTRDDARLYQHVRRVGDPTAYRIVELLNGDQVRVRPVDDVRLSIAPTSTIPVADLTPTPRREPGGPQ